MYCPVCVGPVRKTHCEFSHDEAQICFYSKTSHPEAKIRSTRDRKRCDAQKKEKSKTDIFGKMLCQVKIIDILGQPKEEKNKYIQSDLPPGMIPHFLYTRKRDT